MLQRLTILAVALLFSGGGCAALPDIVHQPQYHNPFPQLSRVAILPFFNQSEEPTVNGEQFAVAYFNELQKIPGYEVAPVGVTKQFVQGMQLDLTNRNDLRRLAEAMGVDAIVVGTITDFNPYYPPRCGLAVDWYAANPSFHPVPAGYGLPWGTAEEEYIPSRLVEAAEFALAKEQLKTQTPPTLPAAGMKQPNKPMAQQTAATENATSESGVMGHELHPALLNVASPLPATWPDPSGFTPPAPQPFPPPANPQNEPVMSHVRNYNGHDIEFTEALANHYYFRDDARFGGWQAYLQRSDDFIAFCCHLHITEMLAARGGTGETRVLWRWPIGRYER